jgi:hypothetical protein
MYTKNYYNYICVYVQIIFTIEYEPYYLNYTFTIIMIHIHMY